MLQNKKILVILTNYRIAEKILNVITELEKYNEITLYCIGEMSLNTKWVGNIDLRKVFINSFYDVEIVHSHGISYHGDYIRNHPFINYNKYDFVLYDDNRKMQEYKIPDLFFEFDKLDIPVIGNSHGNQNLNIKELAFDISYHYLSIFGDNEYNRFPIELRNRLIKGGIPNNDLLLNYKTTSDHILLITNFIGNRSSPFNVNFDSDIVNKLKLNELSKHYNLPIKIKVKSRLDQPNIQLDYDYINSLGINNLDIIFNEPIEQLISNSKFVISALSTLAFKPIQMNIPTVIINGSGQVGNFHSYNNVMGLNDNIFDYVENKCDVGWVRHTIEGGVEFKSTIKYIENLIKAIE